MKPYLITALLLATLPAVADESLQKKTDQLCSKVEQCVWDKLDADNMSAELKKTLRSDLTEVCQSLQPGKNLPPGFKQQTHACLDSMLELECAQLVRKTTQTAACSQLPVAERKDASSAARPTKKTPPAADKP